MTATSIINAISSVSKHKEILLASQFYFILFLFIYFFDCDSLHARLNSHYKAWSYRKRSTKKIAGHTKSVLKEPTVKTCLLIIDLKPLRS